ncbi:MAG: phosphotransferase [Planctomycetes bacterium]|nr:phosphotransferase [Planctomycetota bacterium]MCW8136805.1 phosphotransferase [Planctomycetota bacterium]
MQIINEQLRPELEAAGLLSLDAIFTRRDLQVVKAALTERQTYRTVSPVGTTLYIKRYVDPAPEPFWGGLFAQPFDSPVQREFAVLRRLYKLGVDAPVPAACFEERNAGRIVRAALITLGLPVHTNLEALARSPLAPARRQRLARQLGRILRTMHDGGVNHRDFYLVHILVGDGDRLYVTDLNRADIRKRVTHRWRVKDVAALLHSAPAGVTAADKARFLRAYLGRKGLRGARDFINAVIRKAARMTAHTRKQVARQQPNYHVVD